MIEDPDVSVSRPQKVGNAWVITCYDRVLGDSASKSFSTREMADRARADFLTGTSLTDRVGTRDQRPPRSGFAQIDPTPNRNTQVGARRGKKHFDLNSVADVLYDHGLDPTVELANILKPVPVLDVHGKPKLDDAGRPIMESRLAPSEHARVLLELQQYVHPKLKAVEITQKTLEPTPDEVKAEIQRLIDKAC